MPELLTSNPVKLWNPLPMPRPCSMYRCSVGLELRAHRDGVDIEQRGGCPRREVVCVRYFCVDHDIGGSDLPFTSQPHS